MSQPQEQMDEQAIYRQFTETTQEPLRLSAAIKGFFLEEDMENSHRDAYGAYLRRRIRPAAAVMIDQEATDQLAYLVSLGWIEERLMDEFLQTAQKSRKPAAFVCLLQLKQEYFGFQDRDFSL